MTTGMLVFLVIFVLIGGVGISLMFLQGVFVLVCAVGYIGFGIVKGAWKWMGWKS